MNPSQFSLNKYFYLLFFISFLWGCKSKNDKGEHKRTGTVCNDSLYVEAYRTFGTGAFGSDLVDDYLTDSINFRIRIGNHDEYYGSYYYHCYNDSITVEKMEKSDTVSMQTIETKIYDIRKLRTLQNISKSKIENISDKFLFENK